MSLRAQVAKQSPIELEITSQFALAMTLLPQCLHDLCDVVLHHINISSGR